VADGLFFLKWRMGSFFFEVADGLFFFEVADGLDPLDHRPIDAAHGSEMPLFERSSASSEFSSSTESSRTKMAPIRASTPNRPVTDGGEGGRESE